MYSWTIIRLNIGEDMRIAFSEIVATGAADKFGYDGDGGTNKRMGGGDYRKSIRSKFFASVSINGYPIIRICVFIFYAIFGPTPSVVPCILRFGQVLIRSSLAISKSRIVVVLWSFFATLLAGMAACTMSVAVLVEFGTKNIAIFISR